MEGDGHALGHQQLLGLLIEWNAFRQVGHPVRLIAQRVYLRNADGGAVVLAG